MTALVVGATGMIGLPVSQLLVSKGWKVFATIRATSKISCVEQLRSCGIEAIEYDLLTGDPASLPKTEIVLFLAWDRSHHLDCPCRSRSAVRWCIFCEQYVYHFNYFPAVRLFSHFQASAHILNASSLYVLGDGVEADEMYHSGSPLAPTSTYGRCRADLEQFLQRTMNGEKRYLNLRYLNPQDPKHPGLLQRLSEKVGSGQGVDCANATARIQLIALEDAVQVTAIFCQLLCSQATLPRAINICHPEVWTEHAIVQHMMKLHGVSGSVFQESAGVRSMVADASDVVALRSSLTPVLTMIGQAVAARL